MAFLSLTSAKGEIMGNALIIAFGLFLILEGIMPALFPNKWSNYVTKLANEPKSTIRTIGTVMVVLGGLIIFLN